MNSDKNLDGKDIINAIASGDLKKLETAQKIKSGKLVVISTFYDALRFYNTVDKKGELLDREAQIESGEIEVEVTGDWAEYLKTHTDLPPLQCE